jgi:hypothetical protein
MESDSKTTLGSSELHEINDTNGVDEPIDGRQGNVLLVETEAQGQAEVSVHDPSGNVIAPVASSQQVVGKRNVVVRAYRLLRTGVHRVRVVGRNVKVTVIKIGDDIVEFVKSAPTQNKCKFCVKTLEIALLLALHGYAIPAGGHALEAIVAAYASAEQLLKHIRSILPDWVVEFVTEAVEKLFDDVKKIPKFVFHPLDEAATIICRAINFCPKTSM